jgi:tetratricopeptide (TPR) repeat protein
MHYDDEDLLMFAEGSSPIREEITQHVASCTQCAELLSAHQELAALLGTAEVWEEPVVGAAVTARSHHLSTLAQRIGTEENASSDYVDELLATPSAWWRTKLLRDGEQSIGIVRQLLDRARQRQTTAPLEAEEITRLAVEVGDNLSIFEYPSDLVFATRGHAHRDHAYVLYLLGRLPEALQNTDSAEELFRQTAMPDYDLARVGLMRAFVYSAIDRLPEAITLAKKSSKAFWEFGDMQRFANAQITAAGMLFRTGAHRDALEMWHSVLEVPALDDVARLMVTNNLGMCYREMGEFDLAIRYLATTIAEYELLNMTVLRTRSRGSLATTLVAAGRVPDALPLFEQTWKEFEELGMQSDAALVALELAEGLLIVGRPERVPQICRTILDRFTSAGMTSRAITALAFLREAVALGNAKPTLVRHVYDFLRDLPEKPSRGAFLMARFDD